MATPPDWTTPAGWTIREINGVLPLPVWERIERLAEDLPRFAVTSSALILLDNRQAVGQVDVLIGAPSTREVTLTKLAWPEHLGEAGERSIRQAVNQLAGKTIL